MTNFPIENICEIISPQPITFKMYKNIWFTAHNFEYGRDYKIDFKGHNIQDDDTIIDDSVFDHLTIDHRMDFFINEYESSKSYAVDDANILNIKSKTLSTLSTTESSQSNNINEEDKSNNV